MQETKLPKIIFIVGSASAGKTTLAKIIKKKLPFYNLISDLDELKKPIELERISGNKKTRIKPLVSGGFDIIDPNIWDEVLIATACRIDLKKFYIFEFARGIDQNYLRTLRLKKHQVYDHCFDIILSVLPEIGNKNMLIIHVFSEFKARLHRNERKRQNNEHFVAKKVMQEIYSEDIFHFVSTITENIGYLNQQNKILVFSIDNSKELLPQEIKKYLDNQTQAALKYYNIAHSKKEVKWI